LSTKTKNKNCNGQKGNMSIFNPTQPANAPKQPWLQPPKISPEGIKIDARTAADQAANPGTQPVESSDEDRAERFVDPLRYAQAGGEVAIQGALRAADAVQASEPAEVQPPQDQSA
jgi:hypothetical protein